MKFLALLWVDLLAVRRWFTRQVLARLLVTGAFAMLFVSISIFIFIYSQTFFRNLSFYEIYGQFLADYVLHSAVLVVLWFGVVSAFIETLLTTQQRTARTMYLATLPSTARDLTAWLQFKSLVINSSLAMLILFPAGIAFQIATSKLVVVYLALAIFLLTLFTLGVGTFMGYFWTLIFRQIPRLGVLLAAVLVGLGSLVLFQTIFPSKLTQVYLAPIEDFFAITQQLPLASKELYSYWFVELINGITVNLDSLSILTLTTFGFGYIVQASFLKRAWRENWSRSQKIDVRSNIGLWQAAPRVMVLKDLVVIARDKREPIYAGFLLSLSAIMFALLLRATQFRPLSTLEEGQLLGLVYGWLMFFAIAFMLRFVFPLMSREGDARWLVLNMRPRWDMLIDKIYSGLLLLLPLALLDAGLWLISPFAHVGTIITFTLLSLVCVVLLMVLLGSLSPDFEHSQEPEKTSTTWVGILALLVSLAWVVISEQALQAWIAGSKIMTISSFGGFLLVLFLLYWGSLRKRYLD